VEYIVRYSTVQYSAVYCGVPAWGRFRCCCPPCRAPGAGASLILSAIRKGLMVRYTSRACHSVRSSGCTREEGVQGQNSTATSVHYTLIAIRKGSYTGTRGVQWAQGGIEGTVQCQQYCTIRAALPSVSEHLEGAFLRHSALSIRRAYQDSNKSVPGGGAYLEAEGRERTKGVPGQQQGWWTRAYRDSNKSLPAGVAAAHLEAEGRERAVVGPALRDGAAEQPRGVGQQVSRS